MSYAGRSKYDEPGRAERYKRRSERRNEEEWRLLEGVLEALPAPPADALDVPCGTGRIAERLLDRGIPTRCADLSPAMREATEARLAGRAGYGGAIALDLDLEDAGAVGDQAADLVVCFRFLHHLPSAAHRLRALKTLRRLTRGHLLLSFHHPVSVHNLDRAWKRWLLRRRGDRYTLTRAQLRHETTTAGFDVLRFEALAAWRRELWVALLRPSEP